MSPDDPDLTSGLDAAEAIVMGDETGTACPGRIGSLIAHLDADHAVMVELGRIAEAAVQMLEHIIMDTDEDREFHAGAVGALRGRLGEIAAAMKEAQQEPARYPPVASFAVFMAGLAASAAILLAGGWLLRGLRDRCRAETARDRAADALDCSGIPEDDHAR
jgi:hypothetical protein